MIINLSQRLVGCHGGHIRGVCWCYFGKLHWARWFIAVEKIKDQFLENNKTTYWVPDFVKVTDLHGYKIDHITVPSSRGPKFGGLRWVEDVFDCWFESGSMPYAYIHYPFENVELFEKNFHGHFVAEGLDQTRGWFYTLMVLSTALFGKPAFRNLICNRVWYILCGKRWVLIDYIRSDDDSAASEINTIYFVEQWKGKACLSFVLRSSLTEKRKGGGILPVYMAWELKRRAIELAETRLSKDGWPEYYDGKLGLYIGKQARKHQTWSGYLVAKMLLEDLGMIALEEDRHLKPVFRRSASWSF